MANEKIISYINEKKAKGYESKAIRQALRDAGWQDEDIEEGFSATESMEVPSPSGEFAVQSSAQTPSGLPGVFDLLKQSWERLISRIWTYVGIALLPAVVVIGGMLVMGFLGAVIWSQTGGVAAGILFFTFGLIFVGAIVILQIWAQVSMLYVVNSTEKVGVIDAYRNTLPKLLSYAWITCLVSLVVIGGMVLLFIPGIIVGVWIGLAIYVFILEDVRGMNALIKSKEYVKGRWWPVFGRFVSVGFLFFVAQNIIDVIAKKGGFLVGGTFFVMSIVLSLLTTPFITIYAYLIYRNLKRLRGPFEFVPNKNDRTMFWILAILTPIALIALIILVISVGMSLGSEMDSWSPGMYNY